MEEEFPEEATESSGQQEQLSETSQTQGTVKSLLSVDLSPTADLLEKLRRGRIFYLTGNTPKGESSETKLETQKYKVSG